MSCNPMKSSVKKGSAKLFETFYLGEKGTQYFIKPISFKDTNKEKISMDFTFIYNEKIHATDSATINFSVYPKKRNGDTLILRINNKEKKSGKVKKLFQDAKQIRFSTKVSLIDLKTFLGSNSKSISFTNEYVPQNSTLRKMRKIHSDIFNN